MEGKWEIHEEIEREREWGLREGGREGKKEGRKKGIQTTSLFLGLSAAKNCLSSPSNFPQGWLQSLEHPHIDKTHTHTHTRKSHTHPHAHTHTTIGAVSFPLGECVAPRSTLPGRTVHTRAHTHTHTLPGRTVHTRSALGAVAKSTV